MRFDERGHVMAAVSPWWMVGWVVGAVSVRGINGALQKVAAALTHATR